MLCSPAHEKEEIAIKNATISNVEEGKKLIDNYDLDGDEVEELQDFVNETGLDVDYANEPLEVT